MITVEKSPSGIKVQGHAQYAAAGKDIVCAGVSVLVQTLVEALEELTDAKFEYEMSAGYVDIQFGYLSSRAKLLINAFFIGIEMIANEYPHHVCVTKH